MPKWLAVAGLIALAGGLVSGTFAWRTRNDAQAQAGQALRGQVALHYDIAGTADDCGGIDALHDVGEDAQVVLRDEANVIVGLGRLSNGVGYDAPNPFSPSASPAAADAEFFDWCVLSFEVPSVPDRPFYTITIGAVPRELWAFARTELDEAGWLVQVELEGCFNFDASADRFTDDAGFCVPDED